jgi:hypothetical protein
MQNFFHLLSVVSVAMVLSGCNFSGNRSANFDHKFEFMLGVDAVVHDEKSDGVETSVVTLHFKVPGKYHFVIEAADTSQPGAATAIDINVEDVTKPEIVHPAHIGNPLKMTVFTDGATESIQYGW